MLTRAAVIFNDRHTVFEFRAHQNHSYAFMKSDGFGVGWRGNGFHFLTTLSKRISDEMIVQSATKAKPFMRLANADQMDIGDGRSLREQTEQIGNHPVIFFHDVSRVAEFI